LWPGNCIILSGQKEGIGPLASRAAGPWNSQPD